MEPFVWILIKNKFWSYSRMYPFRGFFFYPTTSSYFNSLQNHPMRQGCIAVYLHILRKNSLLNRRGIETRHILESNFNLLLKPATINQPHTVTHPTVAGPSFSLYFSSFWYLGYSLWTPTRAMPASPSLSWNREKIR